MSMVRLFTRLGMVNCLMTQPTDEYPPTIADGSVFDTRLDDIEFNVERIELPLVQVYTDSSEWVSYSTADGGMDGYHHVILRVVFAIGSFQTTSVDGKKQMAYALPTTDAELEALLDIFEWQIIRAVQHPLRPASLALQALVLNWESWHSEPTRSADKNNRLAERTLTFRLRVKMDCPPATRLDDEQQKYPGTEVPSFQGGEYLNPLLKALALRPENAGLVQDLRELVTGEGRIVVPRFGKTVVTSDTIDPADPNLLAILNRSTGPDGRFEVQQTWDIP